MFRYLLLQGLFIAFSSLLFSQSYSNYENRQFDPFERHVYNSQTPFHTSIRSYRYLELNKVLDIDSTILRDIKRPSGDLNFWKRLFHDNALQWKSDEIEVFINPLFNLELGKDLRSNLNTSVNSRGAQIGVEFKNRVTFYTDLIETQAKFPTYINDYIEEYRVVPGQGKVKDDFINYPNPDYSQSTGYVSADFAKWFNAQLGYGKNFIGDGYRSLLLSDVAYSYPYLKFTASFWNAKYQIMWSKMTHLEREKGGDTRYPSKYSVMHYLDWNIGKRFTLGLYESIIWAERDTAGAYRGFEFAYVNPLQMFRPVEYANGSPDNVTIGINTKYIIGRNYTLYGQLVVGEFKASEVFNRTKWWANKQGFQLGLKTFDLFTLKNLDLQVEYNQVRPFTYSYYFPETNYGHYNQPLAHLLGANFKELQIIGNYRYKRWFLRGQIMQAVWGGDTPEYSYGNNIFRSNTEREKEYGYTIGDGVANELLLLDGTISYLVNARTNFNIVLGARLRSHKEAGELTNDRFIYLGLRTSLKNLYYDF